MTDDEVKRLLDPTITWWMGRVEEVEAERDAATRSAAVWKQAATKSRKALYARANACYEKLAAAMLARAAAEFERDAADERAVALVSKVTFELGTERDALQAENARLREALMPMPPPRPDHAWAPAYLGGVRWGCAHCDMSSEAHRGWGDSP